MGHTFEIKDEFYLDGEKMKVISGGMHYFRVLPEYWRDRLEKLKALGCNTVETYIPWNLHEKEKGVFDFSGMLDITRFVRTAQELGLWVILRPSPYICAEWEFGGLPWWLLKEDGMKLRCMYDRFVRTAQELGLWVILRPSPYICAEWEFGGLPWWLLKEDGMKLRCMYEPYLKHVKEYYEKLFEVIAPLQVTEGGPVIFMQIENE